MRRKMLAVLIVVAALVGVTSCSSYRHCQWRKGDQSVNDTAEYSLRFIESDDEGWFWDPAQVTQTMDLIRRKAGERDTVVVTFVHGWHHSAQCCDGNVEGFRNTLSHLHKSLNPDGARFNIVGLYIGWRGQSLAMPFDYLTFWGRKGAAERVGQNDLKEFMARLQDLFLEYRPDARKPDPDSPPEDSPPPRYFLGMVTLGHSFGGQVLLKAVTGSLEDQLQDLNTTPAYLRDAQPAVPSPDRTFTVSGIGDLVVLINPAAEASQYHRLHLLSRGLAYSDLQTPLILTVSAENDRARHRLFTLGRRFGEFFTGKPHKENEVERTVEREALGVYRGHVTHQLVPTDSSMRLESTDITGDSRPCGKQVPCTTQWYQWAGPSGHPKPPSLVPGDSRLPGFDFSGEVVFSDVELSPLSDKAIHDLGEDPAKYAKAQPYQPFIVARASREIIDDHSGIFTQPFLQFLVPYIANIEEKSKLNVDDKVRMRKYEMQTVEAQKKAGK